MSLLSTRARRVIAVGATVLAAGGTLAACGNSAADHPDASDHPKVTIMVGGIDKVIYLPAMLTQQLGYFKDSGVDVKLLTEPSGSSAENMLIAHKVQGVVGFYDHTVVLQAQGKCVQSVVQLAKVPGEAEVVGNDSSITSSADFKDKKLGITSPGSSTDYLTQYMAHKAGVDSADYASVTAGAGSTFLSALQQGGIGRCRMRRFAVQVQHRQQRLAADPAAAGQEAAQRAVQLAGRGAQFQAVGEVVQIVVFDGCGGRHGGLLQRQGGSLPPRPPGGVVRRSFAPAC